MAEQPINTTALLEQEQTHEYPPQLEWEELPGGLRKWHQVITDLPPEAFTTFEYKPLPSSIHDARRQGRNPYYTEDGERIYEVGIDPVALGELPVGTYNVRTSEWSDLDITLIEDENGKYFTFAKHQRERDRTEEYFNLAGAPAPAAKAAYIKLSLDHYVENIAMQPSGMVLGRSAYEVSPLLFAMFQELQYKNAGDNHLLFPTPQTLQRRVKELGLPVLFITRDQSKQAATPLSLYQESFGRGEYPIGTVDLAYYLHDISDDHIDGALLGYFSKIPGQKYEGETLLTLFAPLVRQLQENGNDRADSLDLLTTASRRLMKHFYPEPAFGRKKQAMPQGNNESELTETEVFLLHMHLEIDNIADMYDAMSTQLGRKYGKVEEVYVKTALYKLAAWQAKQLSDDPEIIEKAELLELEAQNIAGKLIKAGRIATDNFNNDEVAIYTANV